MVAPNTTRRTQRASAQSRVQDVCVCVCVCPQSPSTDQALLALIASTLTDVLNVDQAIAAAVMRSNATISGLNSVFDATDELYYDRMSSLSAEVRTHTHTQRHIHTEKNTVPDTQRAPLGARVHACIGLVLCASVCVCVCVCVSCRLVWRTKRW